MLEIKQERDGNLWVVATAEGREYLQNHVISDKYDEILGWDRDCHTMWSDLLEQYSVNGSYTYATADEVGCLSNAPVILEWAEYKDDGRLYLPNDAKFWFYADYCICDEFAKLLEGEPLLFTLSE